MAAQARKRLGWQWNIAPPFDGAAQLARQAHTAPLVTQVLHNRGISDVQAIRRFMSPKLSDLHDPQLLGGVEPAARRIAEAIRRHEKIVIYGDYDVDGMTAVAILHACLKLVDAEAHYYVPHRLDEGYGVNAEAVQKILADGADLIVTVDCGITAVGPIAAARAAGVDVIVTDHHSLPAELPDAMAIVHPMVPADSYPNPNLAGAGVALKLAWQVARELCGSTRVDQAMRNFLLDATCLAALGTIADVVPLVGENRSLAVHGLAGLGGTTHVGLRALLDGAGLTGQQVDAFHVGFVLAPRLNAAGRMGHARLAVELLTGRAGHRSGRIVRHLDAQNTQRQQVEREITAEAIELIEAGNLADDDHRAIVLASNKWHGGVIGIVASRLVDRFARPAILIAINGDGLGQGSGRSISSFHMRDALAACGEHLVGFGGHAMAGGLRIQQQNIDAFADAFVACANATIADTQLTPALDIDAEVTLDALSYRVVEHLMRLAPFGQGNRPPLVALRGCRLVNPPKRMGRNGKTIGMTLGQGKTLMRAVGFNMGDLVDSLAGVTQTDVAAEPTLNTFQGRTNVELKLKDVVWE